MGGTRQDMGWDGEGSNRRKGREREERGYSPQTSIPGAATGRSAPFPGQMSKKVTKPDSVFCLIVFFVFFYEGHLDCVRLFYVFFFVFLCLCCSG